MSFSEVLRQLGPERHSLRMGFTQEIVNMAPDIRYHHVVLTRCPEAARHGCVCVCVPRRHEGVLAVAHLPQVYVGGEFVGGCDIMIRESHPSSRGPHLPAAASPAPQLCPKMFQSGELTELLEKEMLS
ncbi:hypothetical protein QJQ45_028052 [Haematococcus lacustris]|nr:hypothetical protein QJQ45_028052 [Haematococcus lacustris]